MPEPQTPDAGVHATGAHGLTPRQLEILTLLSKGLSNRDICELLHISNNTVKVHVATILRALGVANRTEAASAYQRLLGEQDDVGVRVRTAHELGRPMIAVLPFDNLASAEDADHLAAGFVDDLITRLSGWRWFPVIASVTTNRFAQTDTDLQQLREELGAGYVIKGSVRLSGERVRVSAHLLETERGTGVWSDAFDASVHDVLSTQDEIARRIVACLAPELMEMEGKTHEDEPHTDFDAWRLTMMGMWSLAHRTREDVVRAAELFERALALDPRFSLAWYGRTWCHHHNVIEQWAEDRAEEVARLEHAAAECVRTDPNGAPAQTVAGLVEMIRGNNGKAISHLERAASLNPSSTQALSLLGQCYGLTGRADECIAVLEDALMLNPYSPTVWLMQAVMALAHFVAQRHEEAIEWSRTALNGRPQMITPHLTLCASLVEKGEVAAGRQVIADMRRLRPEYALNDFVDLIGRSADPDIVARISAALEAAEAGT